MTKIYDFFFFKFAEHSRTNWKSAITRPKPKKAKPERRAEERHHKSRRRSTRPRMQSLELELDVVAWGACQIP